MSGSSGEIGQRFGWQNLNDSAGFCSESIHPIAMFYSRPIRGAVLEVKRGFAKDGWSSARVELASLRKRDIEKTLEMLDAIAVRMRP